MLPVLALGLVLAQSSETAVPVPTSTVAFERLMASAGYPVERMKGGSDSYEIVRGATRVWVGVINSYSPERGKSYPGFSLRIEFAAGRGAGFRSFDARSLALKNEDRPAFAYHLGGTITERQTVELWGGTTRAKLKASLDRFFREGRAVASRFGVAYVPVPAVRPAARFADATTLDRADEISLRRATASWGWKEAKEPGFASQGWLFPIRVTGKRLVLRQAVEGSTASARSIVVARYDDRPTTRDPWSDRQLGGPTFPAVVYLSDGKHLPIAEETLDLGPGLTLGQIRGRIEAFAARG